MTFNRDQIIALAPDTASVKAAEKLLSPGKWPLLQFNDNAIWGECQGSGASPYQSRIDLDGPAFKCSCPSRKFPCKHGLALFLLFCERQQAFTQAQDAPPWVSEWIASRFSKEQKKAEAVANPKPVDEAAKAKREEKRQQRVEQGIIELLRWLEDVARVGLGDLHNKNYAYWEHLAARLVDAQAGGLAFRVRRLGDQVIQGASHLQITAQIAELALLTEAASRLDQLPDALQQDIRTQVGWTLNQDDILAHQGFPDQWWVWSHRIVQEENMLRQEILLQGCNSGRFARLIQYAHTAQRTTLLQGWLPGRCYHATAHFYPGTHPLRAVLPDSVLVPDPAPPQKRVDIDTMVSHYQTQLQQQPWLGEWPFVLQAVTPQVRNNQLWLHQAESAVPAQLTQRETWQLLALSAGTPVAVVGDWDGEFFRPLSVATDASVLALNATCLTET